MEKSEEKLKKYISAQGDAIETAQRREDFSSNLLEKLQELNVDSDTQLRIHNFTSGITYPVNGTKSPDPVYSKLSEFKEMVHRERVSYEGIIADLINNWQIKMESRKMTERDYNYFLTNSYNKLLSNWIEDIAKDDVPF